MVYSAYVAMSAYGLYLLKTANNWSDLRFLFGFMFYGLGAVTWLYIIRTFPLSVAFPIAAGALVLATLFLGIFILGEQASFCKLLGAGFIVFGIYAISRG